MLTRRWITVLALLAAPLVVADSATLRVVTEKAVADGWTEPKVTEGQGGSSYAPAVPTGVSTRDLGAVVDVGSATVHSATRDDPPESSTAHIEYRYRLRLPDGTAVNLTPGVWRAIGTDAVRLTRLSDGAYALQYRNSGRTLRLRAQSGNPPAKGSERPATAP